MWGRRKRKRDPFCTVCDGRQIRFNGLLVCTDCDYAISWPQFRRGVCFHIPGCRPTLEKEPAE